MADDPSYILNFNFSQLGDMVATCGLPENIYRFSGAQCIVTQDHWVFTHNPYVRFVSKNEAENGQNINLHITQDAQSLGFAKDYYVPIGTERYIKSQTELMCRSVGISYVPLRHPRLYIYEDLPTQPDKIVVHTTGGDRTKLGEAAFRAGDGEECTRVMSDAVIAAILHNYRDYQIVQIGGAEDKPLGGKSIDLRGQRDYFGSAKEIATAARFIGVNSGPMHIAHCYPRVDTRIVLMEFAPPMLIRYSPGDVSHYLFTWLDPADRFFNKFEEDIGFTASYLKI